MTNDTIIWVGWIVSVALMVLTVAAIIATNAKRSLRIAGFSSWVLLIIGTALAGFSLVLSQILAGLLEPAGEIPLVAAFIDTVDLFIVNRQLSVTADQIACLGPFVVPYLVYDAALFVVASTATIGAAFTLIGSLFDGPRIWVRSYGSNTFVFSELNEQTRLLALSLAKKYPASFLLVFCSQSDGNKEAQEKVLDAICNEGGKASTVIFTKGDIASVRNHINTGSAKRSFVYGSEDEQENFDGVLGLLDYFEETVSDKSWPKEPADVYLFSTSAVDGTVLDARLAGSYLTKPYDGLDKGDFCRKPAVRIMRINAVQQTVYNLIDRAPVFLSGEDLYDSNASIVDHYTRPDRHVLIVGDTYFAREYLKGLLWSSQMGEDFHVKISYLSANAEYRVVPELKAEVPGVFEQIGAHFDLSFVECDPAKAEYVGYLASKMCADVTMVVVDVGADRLNADIAMLTREQLERASIKRLAADGRVVEGGSDTSALIYAVIHDDRLAASVRLLESSMSPKTRYAIHPICTDKEVFTCENLFNGVVADLGRAVNRLYSSEGDASVLSYSYLESDADYWRSEYNRTASIASALHLKYGLYVFCRKYIAGALEPVDGVPMPDKAELELIDWTLPLGHTDEHFEAALEAYDRYMKTDVVAKAIAPTADFSSPFTWRMRMEHDRWDAEKWCRGYVVASEEEISSFYGQRNLGKYNTRIPIAKTHACLIPFDCLSSVDKLTGKDVGCLEVADVNIVNNMRAILHSI